MRAFASILAIPMLLIFTTSSCLFNKQSMMSETDLLENALNYAYNFRGNNDSWTPYEYAFDNIIMVLVPAGCFMMGSNDGDWDEEPINEVCFEEPFWIGKFEVTNQQYGSIGCEEASHAPDQPRNCVNWTEARVFCESHMMRLPTEGEWEYAARGPDSLRYPWGNVWDSNKAIHSANASETAIVGSTPEGISWVGAMDMSGNVWEWVNSKNWDYPYNVKDGREVIDNVEGRGRQLRGGSWNNNSGYLRAANRGGNDGGLTIQDIGFRCATDSKMK